MIIEIKNNKQFEELISKGTTLVDFFATWCGPCKMLSPVLHQVDEENKLGDINILKVDVDENMDIARKYNIQAVPTLILIKDSKIINIKSGYLNEDQLISFVK